MNKDIDIQAEVLHMLYGSGKPMAFVEFAVMAASMAKDSQTLISWVIGRTKPPRPLPPVPELDPWLRLYRNHRSFMNEIGELFGLPQELTATDLQSSMRELSDSSPEEIQSEFETWTEEQLKEFITPFMGVPFPPDKKTLSQMLAESDEEAETNTDEETELLDELLSSLSGQFFIRVWYPCVIMYRCYPSELLRKARLGDEKAFDKLLRLDKSTANDPIIKQRCHALAHSPHKRERDFVANALSGEPIARLDLRSIKLGLAGLISQIAKQFHCKVTAPEISQLFNMISEIRIGRNDPDQSPTIESYSKAIQRNRNWPSMKK